MRRFWLYAIFAFLQVPQMRLCLKKCWSSFIHLLYYHVCYRFSLFFGA